MGARGVRRGSWTTLNARRPDPRGDEELWAALEDQARETLKLLGSLGLGVLLLQPFSQAEGWAPGSDRREWTKAKMEHNEKEIVEILRLFMRKRLKMAGLLYRPARPFTTPAANNMHSHTFRDVGQGFKIEIRGECQEWLLGHL